MRRVFVMAVAVALLSCSLARADEGMWTFDHFPSHAVGAKYGFTPSQAWLDHVQRASLRLEAGCSGSFISPNGLALTNHHCVVGCVQHLSTPQQDFVQTGFIAKTADDERACPAFAVDQLTSIRNVTPTIRAALAGKTGDAANRALDAAKAKLQQGCGSDPEVLCEVVSLYHGGIYDLYRYVRYSDVRLVFAPEFDVAQFGGDPDNFNFPRYDYDIGIIRVYDKGKPLATKDYLRWSAHGTKPGDLVFISGNPGQTSRALTTAQLAFERDQIMPSELPEVAEYRGELEAFSQRGPEQAREARDSLFGWANYYKVRIGEQQALIDPQFFGTKKREEAALRAKVAASPALAAADGSAWNDIARVQTTRAKLLPRTVLGYFDFVGQLMGTAITLVRAGDERKKPNGQRLPEYTDQGLVAIEQQVTSPIPIYKDFETLNLTFIFTLVQRDLGPDDPFVHKMLGTQSPEQLAQSLVSQTHLDDPKVRAALYSGGAAAIAASTDPLIRFAVAIDPDLRAQRKEHETDIDAPTRIAAERIAAARFAVYGTSVYPDATFTPRLNYGVVKGFTTLEGHAVAPYTTFGGLFERANGAPPYDLPPSWLAAKSTLDLTTPYNFSMTADIIGGNSGSPIVDKNGDFVGIVFDGNIYSLGGDYGYEPVRNRGVGVDSRGILAGLRSVYHVDRIADEIEGARR